MGCIFLQWKLFRLMNPKTLMLQTLFKCQPCYESCFNISIMPVHRTKIITNTAKQFIWASCSTAPSWWPERTTAFSTSCCVLTENCTVFARLRGILLVLLPEWWALSLQSQYTVRKQVKWKKKQNKLKTTIDIYILMLRGNLRRKYKAIKNSQYLDHQFMINGKSWVLKRLDDRRVGVGQLCVFSNQCYSHVFQKTVRSDMGCSSNYLIVLKKEHFRVEHFHTCQPSLSTLWAVSCLSSSQTCSYDCRSSSQPPVLPARGVLCKWRKHPGYRSPKNDNKKKSCSGLFLDCYHVHYNNLWRLHVAKHWDLLLYHCFQGCRTATHNLMKIKIRTMLLAYEGDVEWYSEGERLQIKLTSSAPFFFCSSKEPYYPHRWKDCCAMFVF